MARSVQLEHVAAKSAASKRCGQALETTSEIAEMDVAVHSRNAGTTGRSSPGEEKQRAKLLKFLNVPASQGMRPQMRQAGRHWAEGFSQSDVARKLNMDPSTVARMINGALKMADARG
jgi:ribosome-binding protein aMBF1 (putative translation factor)